MSSFARVLSTGEIDGNHPQRRKRSEVRNVEEEDDVEDFVDNLASTISLQDSSQGISNASRSESSATTSLPGSRLSRGTSKSSKEDLNSTVHTHNATIGVVVTQDSRQQSEDDDCELGECRDNTCVRLPDTRNTKPTPPAVYSCSGGYTEEESKTQEEEVLRTASIHHSNSDYDDDGCGQEIEYGFQKAVLYQNRVPVVSATEMNDIDFWSIDGQEEEEQGCFCRHRRLLLLLTAIAVCGVGVWLCISYFALPSYIAAGNSGAPQNEQETNTDSNQDDVGIGFPTLPSTTISTIAPTEMHTIDLETNTTTNYDDLEIPNAATSTPTTEFATDTPTLVDPVMDDNISISSFETESPMTFAPSSNSTMNATMFPGYATEDATSQETTFVPSITAPPSSFTTSSPTFPSLPLIIGHGTTNLTVFAQQKNGTETNATTTIAIDNSTLAPTTTSIFTGVETELTPNGTNGVP